MRTKFFVASSMILTLAIMLFYMLGVWLPLESTPEWLLSGIGMSILIVVWLYSLINTFNVLWLNQSDTLLELIHGFSVVGILWFLASSFGVLSIQQLGAMDLQIQHAIAMIVIYFSLIRTMIHVKKTRISNIARWITLIAISLATGMTLTAFFVNVEPSEFSDNLFSKVYISSYMIAFTGFVITVLFHLLNKAQDESCAKIEKTV